jgi:pimeloyl-ACP methyl ester carboxylesterase
MRMRWQYLLLLMGLCLSCQIAPRQYSFVTEPVSSQQPDSTGLIVVLSGIEGPGWATDSICGGLRDAGLSHTIQTYDWTTGAWYHITDHLWDYEANRRAAKDLAERLMAYRQEHPDKPVRLIGMSGGAGITLWTLEALPVNFGNCQAILLCPGVSPWFDLTAALQRTDRGLYCFRSALDCLVLGIGTMIGGTLDRQWTPAAGAIGFVVPEEYERAQWYGARFTDYPYSKVMADFGHFGFHMSWSSRSLIAKVVAPLVAQGDTK